MQIMKDFDPSKMGSQKPTRATTNHKVMQDFNPALMGSQPLSDEELIKNYVKNVPLSDFTPQKWKNLTTTPSEWKFGTTTKAPSIPLPVAPSKNYSDNATAEAFQRKRYEAMDMDNFAGDMENALETYKKISSGWQDAETMKNAKPIIEKARNRLLEWQKYNTDYNIGIDYSEHLKAYNQLLEDWDGIAEEYAKHPNAEMYERKTKADAEVNRIIQEVPLEEHNAKVSDLESKLEKAKTLYGDYTYATNQKTSAYTPEHYEKYAAMEEKAKKAYEDYIKKIGYKNIEEIEKDLGLVKTTRKKAERYQRLRELSDVSNPKSENYDKDFEKYVKKGNEIDYHEVGTAKKGYGGGSGGSAYSYDVPDALRLAAMALAEHNGVEITEEKSEQIYSDYGFAILRYLEPEEFDTLAYYIAKDKETGGNQAQEYIELMEEELNRREGTYTFETYLKDNSFLETLYAVPVNLERFGTNLAYLFNTEDDYIPLSSTQVAGQLAREDLADNGMKLPEWLGGASGAQLAYDMLGTTTYMLPSILVGFVSKTGGAVLLGAASAGGAYQEALNSGMDKGQARVYSTLVGVSEAALSRVMSKAFGGEAVSGKIATAIKGVENGFYRFALNMGTAVISEATEEGLQEILEPLFENIALGYNKNGFEDIDWSEVAYSALMGGLSGGMFETLGSGVKKIKSVIDVIRNYNTDSSVLGLIKLGLSFDKNSKAYKLANKYSTEFSKNKGISRKKVYNLANTLQNTVGYTLMKLGETDNADALASIIVKKLSGVEISTKEIETLSKNKYGQEVLRTIVPKAESENTIETENSLQEGVGSDIIENNQETGVDIDDSTNPELLEGRKVSAVGGSGDGVRQQSENSRALSDRLGSFSAQSEDSNKSVQAGSEGWLVRRGQASEIWSRLKEGLHRKLSGIKLKDTDSAGRRLSKSVQNEFADTVLKNEDGTIISIFHYTQNEFDEFEYGDIGFHGGTLQASFDRQDQNAELGKSHIFKEMYARVTNPLFFESDGGVWDAEAVASRAKTAGVITQNEYDYLEQLEGFNFGKYSDEASVETRRILKEKGYDGIVYINEHEDAGSLSVIVFDADQFLTVAENGVLKENSGVTEADTQVPANFMPESQTDGDIDQEITDNDMYAKDPSQWSAENKNDSSVSKSFKEKLANLFGKNTDKKTTSISEIVKLIEKDFEVPISKGKFRQRAYGIYKNKSQAIRTKVSNALPTIAHELGHHLDNKYHLRNFESIGEAERVLKETRPDFYNSYKPMARPREAVAEFMRDYLADRNLAKEKYPFFFEEFERKLSEGGTEAQKDLENIKIIGDKINEYYTAELSERAKAAILTRKEAKKINRMGENLESISLRIETEMLDDAAIFKKISQKAYDAYYWAKKSSVRAKNALAGDYMAGFNKDLAPYRDKDGNVVKDDNGNTVYAPALKFILAEIENNDMLKDFNEYLVMRHGIEWLNNDLRVFADDSLNNKKYMQQRIKELENQYSQFKDVSENLYEWYRTLVYEYGVESGLMTKEQYQSLVEKYPFYVPFMRNVESKKGFAKSGLGNQNAPIKRAKGSGLEILSPIESLVIKTEQFMKAADRNAVMKEIADTADSEDGFGWLLEEVPPDMIPNTISSDVIKSAAKKSLTNSGFDESAVDDFSNLVDILIGESITDFKIGTVQGENVVAVRRNGKRTLYQIHDKNLLAAVVGLQPNQFDVVTKAMGKVTKVFKALTTGSNAVWSIVSNAPRDFDSAYKYGSENNPIKYTVDYIKAVMSQTSLSKNKETLKLYRTMGGGYNNSFANAKELQLTAKELFKQNKTFTDKIKSLFNIVNNVTKLADFVETAPRLAEFKRVYERTGDAKKAMLAAEEVTVNFNRSGKLSKTLDQYLPYFNASLQANAKYAKTIAKAFSKGGDKSFLVKSIVTAMIKTGITFGILGLFGDEGEEEYEKLSAYKKNNFYNIYLGDGKFYSIPKSQATGVFDSFLERVFEISRKEDVEWGQEVKDFANYMWLTFGPPLFDDIAVVGTAMELASNEDFTGAPIVSSYYEDLVPEMQYNERTTYIAKFLGQLLGWSPMKIDHVIESNLGVFGLINKSIGKSEKDWTLGTKTKTVTDSAYSTDILNNFYDKAEEYYSKSKSYPDNAEYVYKNKQYTAIKSIVSALNEYGREDPTVAREFKILARDYVDDFEKNQPTDKKLIELLERSGNEEILYDRTFKPTYTLNKVEYKMESQEFLELVEQYYKEVKEEYAEVLNMNLSDEATVRLLIQTKKDVYEKVSKKYKVKR